MYLDFSMALEDSSLKLGPTVHFSELFYINIKKLWNLFFKFTGYFKLYHYAKNFHAVYNNLIYNHVASTEIISTLLERLEKFSYSGDKRPSLRTVTRHK